MLRSFSREPEQFYNLNNKREAARIESKSSEVLFLIDKLCNYLDKQMVRFTVLVTFVKFFLY